MVNTERVEIIIPDGKNIRPALLGLIERRDFVSEERSNGNFHLDALNVPVSFTLLNPRDVIKRVAFGYYDGGFVGEELWEEYLASLGSKVPMIQRVPGSFEVFQPNLRLSIIVRDNPDDNVRYQKVTDLSGQTMLTTYPALIRQHLAPLFLEAKKDMPIIDGDITGKEERELANYKCEAAGVIVDTGISIRDALERELLVVRTGIQVALIYNPGLLVEKGIQRTWDRVVNQLHNGVSLQSLEPGLRDSMSREVIAARSIAAVQVPLL